MRNELFIYQTFLTIIIVMRVAVLEHIVSKITKCNVIYKYSVVYCVNILNKINVVKR